MVFCLKVWLWVDFMKKIIAIAAIVAASTASAGWFNNGNNGYNGYNGYNGSNNWGPFNGGSNAGPFNGGSKVTLCLSPSVADRPLRPAIDRRLGEPLPHSNTKAN